MASIPPGSMTSAGRFANWRTRAGPSCVSSHILAEVEQIADSLSIVARGRLLASGTVAEVVGHQGHSVRVGVDDLDGAATVLNAAGLDVRRDGETLVVAGEPDPARISELLAREGRYVSSLSRSGTGLEAAFLELTAGLGLTDTTPSEDSATLEPGADTEGRG